MSNQEKIDYLIDEIELTLMWMDARTEPGPDCERLKDVFSDITAIKIARKSEKTRHWWNLRRAKA